MADHLRREGCWIPILVSAPDGEHDAGPIALLETAGQLVENEILDGETQVLADPRRSWTEKMATITRAVDRRDDVVLLCDEPAGWYHRDESLLEHTPDYSARSFAEWIAAGTLCRRVIAGWIPGNAGPAVPVDVPQLADGRDILDVEADWDVLWEPASRLRKSVSDPLPFRSAMEMKLCVALASLLPRDEPVALSKSDASAKVILERLFDQVERRAEFCGFCATLARLALVRTPLRKAVVDEFTAGLEPPARSVIEICLLDRYDGRAALHPLVRNQVRGRATRRVEGVPRERCQPWRLRKERLKEVHDRLKGEYDDKTKGPPRDSLESFHHELLGSGADLRHSAGRIQFVEQLDEIGRTLSHRQRDHGRAVEVYRLAVESFRIMLTASTTWPTTSTGWPGRRRSSRPTTRKRSNSSRGTPGSGRAGSATWRLAGGTERQGPSGTRRSAR